MALDVSRMSIAEQAALLLPDQRAAFLAEFCDTPDKVEAFPYNWDLFARPKQQEPEGDWTVWLLCAGRGFGKTRCGAEWVRRRVELGARRIYLVGATAGDVRRTMLYGESGLLNIGPPAMRPKYYPSQARIVWPPHPVTGIQAEALLFTAEKPDRLRGPAADTMWCDELAAWKYPDAWDQAMFGLRSAESGLMPRAVVTTTPRPIPIIRKMVWDDCSRCDCPDPEHSKVEKTAPEGTKFFLDKCVYCGHERKPGGKHYVTRGSTYDNVANLHEVYTEAIIGRYEGTRLGRQELNAEILDDSPGALWNRTRIESLRMSLSLDTEARQSEWDSLLKSFHKIVVSVDPAVTANKGVRKENSDPMAAEAKRKSNETGIIVGGIRVETDKKTNAKTGHVYILDDASGIYKPDEWAAKVVALFDQYEANYIVCEVNQGGDLVASNIRTVRRHIPIKEVRATRGKVIRAEPVAALGEQGRVHHVGSFPILEDQLCSWESDSGMPSPDRLDAYVWLLTDLMIASNPDRGGRGGGGNGRPLPSPVTSPLNF